MSQLHWSAEVVVSLKFKSANSMSDNSGSNETGTTADIREWRSIVTLVVFVITSE